MAVLFVGENFLCGKIFAISYLMSRGFWGVRVKGPYGILWRLRAAVCASNKVVGALFLLKAVVF